MPFEELLIEHCSPTLASLKTGSLFCADCELEAERWNALLHDRGLTVTVLRRRAGRVLVYVYRRSNLERDLAVEGAAEFLAGCGYDCGTVERAIERLRERLAESEEFPHEIGLFLGYPLEDVTGFIRNGGRCFKCAGCWKVYGDRAEAERRFASFRKCREIYSRLHRRGRTVRQLTVAA
jgi:hypothetical protein